MAEKLSAAEIFIALRNQALAIKRVNIQNDDDFKHAPFGLVMDESLPSGHFYTLVAWNNGETSIYLSSGGGFIGAGQHPAPNIAASELVKFAANYSDHAVAVKTALLPEQDECSFYFVTDTGLLGAHAAAAQLKTGKHALSLLYVKAQHLIAAIRLQAGKK